MKMERKEEFVQGGEVGHLCFSILVTKMEEKRTTRTKPRICDISEMCERTRVIDLLTRMFLLCETLMRCLFFQIACLV